MPKATIIRKSEDERLKQLRDRLNQFMELNNLTRPNVSPKEQETLDTQNLAFGTVLTLVNQLIKRGDLWTGGYLDNVGVVYSDQVGEIIEELRANV